MPQPRLAIEPKTLLLVDDEPVNLHVLRNILAGQYRLLFAKDGDAAIDLARRELPDLVLLDIMMPGKSGYEVCSILKADPAIRHIPVIFVTAISEVDDEGKGFGLGAVDYITKPVSPAFVKARVKNHLSLVQVEELKQTQLSIVQRLGRAAEYKDNETGTHVIRMSAYSRIIALAAGLSEAWAEVIFNAAPMHDIGKIGIPDCILQKPTTLSADEWIVMRRHTEIGAEILGDDRSALLQMARNIALNHHEKWDGTGYPQGLAGEAIPIEARIVAIADVFDALTSERPYKNAWSVEQAVAFMVEQQGRHFDPGLVEVFLESLSEIREAMETWQ